MTRTMIPIVHRTGILIRNPTISRMTPRVIVTLLAVRSRCGVPCRSKEPYTSRCPVGGQMVAARVAGAPRVVGERSVSELKVDLTEHAQRISLGCVRFRGRYSLALTHRAGARSTVSVSSAPFWRKIAVPGSETDTHPRQRNGCIRAVGECGRRSTASMVRRDQVVPGVVARGRSALRGGRRRFSGSP